MIALGHARVLRVAVPIAISNMTIPLLGLVNTGVVGWIGEAAPIGAVGIGAVVLVSFYWIFGFLRMGTTGLVAQAQGRGDRAEMSLILIRALAIAACAGGGLIALQKPIFDLAFALAPASAEVEHLARAYLGVRIWGAPATIGLYALTGWLIACERTKAVLAIQVGMNSLNVVLDIWFVLGLGRGVTGVAEATLIAEYAGLLMALWFARDAFRLRPTWAAVFNMGPLAQMLRVNTDIMIRSMLLQACLTTFLFLGAGEGDVALAANQILLQFLEVMIFVLDGFAFAAETLVGQAVGARDAQAVRRAAILSSQWAVGGVVVMSAGFIILGPAFVDMMSQSALVREAARQFLPWLWIAPLIGVAGWMFDGIFIGATLTRDMRNVAFLAALAFAGVLAVAVPIWGNHGLWAALMTMNATRGICMGRLYPRAEAKARAECA